MIARLLTAVALSLVVLSGGCNDGREPAKHRGATAERTPSVEKDASSGQAESTDQSTEAHTESPAPHALPPGMSFQSAGNPESAEQIEKDVKPLTDAERERYKQVAVALVTAINAEDRNAYRALHTDKGWNTAIDWWKNMFALQTSKWGRINRAWPPTRGIVRVGGLGFRGDEGASGATVMIHFEDGPGGALTFSLDPSGKIDHTSVFLKEELGHYAPAGVKPIYELPGAD